MFDRRPRAHSAVATLLAALLAAQSPAAQSATTQAPTRSPALAPESAPTDEAIDARIRAILARGNEAWPELLDESLRTEAAATEGGAAAAPASTALALASARALAAGGTKPMPLLPRLVAALPKAAEPARTHLLATIANLALWADAQSRTAIEAAIPEWARAGLFYSPAADRPSLAFQQHVRLRERLRLAAAGNTWIALGHALDDLQSRPIGIGGGFVGTKRPTPLDLDRLPIDGRCELLEAVADFARTTPDIDEDALELLARILEVNPEDGSEGFLLQLTGKAMPMPADLPAQEFRVTWETRTWRFAVARAVAERHPGPERRALALKRLMRSGEPTLVFEALAAVRTWPAAWPDPSPWLGAGVALLLIAKDRTIVREALVTLGQSAALARHARYSLERLARGQDEELALLARKAQQAATPR